MDVGLNEKGLGKQLQAARQAGGLTQQQLCQRANISFSTLTKIERGAIKSPSIFTVQSIAVALGVGLEELLGAVSPAPHGRTLHRSKKGVSFVYFDVNGCLVNFYQRAFAELARATGAPFDTVETAFLHYNAEVCRGTMSMSDFNAKLAKRLGVKEVKWEQYYLSTVEPIMQMQEIVKSAAEHYKVGLLTNIMPGLLGAMRRSGQIPNINYDAVIDSSEVAAIKPESKIYQIATKKAEVPAGQILLIDDSPVNLTAAERMGWQALWFNDSSPSESVERVRKALELAP